MRIGGIDFGVQHHGHPVAQVSSGAILEVAVKLDQPRMAKPGHQRQHGAHRKFRLVHGSRVKHRAQYVDGTLVHMRDHAGDVASMQLVVQHHLQQRIGSGMGMAAGSVVFEGRLNGGPTLAQRIR